MLELTGTVNGKTYNKEIVSVDVAIDLFKVNKYFDGKTDLRFHLNEKDSYVVAINAADGKRRFGNYDITTFLTGFYEGQNIQLRYFESALTHSKGHNVYSPNYLYFRGLSKKYDLTLNREQALYLLLFPWCAESPLRSRNHQKVYYVKDAEKEAELALESALSYNDLMTEIISASDELVGVWARGITVGRGNRVNPAQIGNAAAERVSLLKLAQSHTAEMGVAMRKHETVVVGTVMKAHSDGKVIPKQGKGGVTTWSYSKELGGERLARVNGKGAKPLIEHLSNHVRWLEFTKKLGVDATGNAPAVEALVENVDIVEHAFTSRVLALHPIEDKVYLLNAKGQFDDKALIVLKGPREQWKSELRDRISPQIEGKINKRLEA